MIRLHLHRWTGPWVDDTPLHRASMLALLSMGRGWIEQRLVAEHVRVEARLLELVHGVPAKEPPPEPEE